MSKIIILKKISQLKNQPYGSVTIKSTINDISFHLILITKYAIDDMHVISLLGKWRKENEKWFQSQFEITNKRTQNWLLNGVINQDRLLFLIKVNNLYYGHVGLFRFDFWTNSCEVDNVIRGKNGVKGLMAQSIKSLMDWGKKELSMQRYTLKVREDNFHAVKFYKKIGFKVINKIPLVYKKIDETTQLIVGKMDDVGDKYYLEMELK